MKLLFIVLGSLSLGLGVVGIFVPLLPTTPFLLLSAACYFRSSPELYRWLVRQRYLGGYIRNYREHKAMTPRAKIFVLLLMWGTLLYCIFGVVDNPWGKAGLVLVGLGVSVHICTLRSSGFTGGN